MVTPEIIMSCSGRPASSLGMRSNLSRTSRPSITDPKTVYFPLRWLCARYVIKNWLVFVFLPLFAMDSTPRLLCLSVGTISSLNLPPYILTPPFPVPSGSPPWIMNPLMFRWNLVSS
jgi:hypothetical protein